MSPPKKTVFDPSAGAKGEYSRAFYNSEIKIPNSLFYQPSGSLMSSKGNATIRDVKPAPSGKELFAFDFPHAQINNDLYTVVAGTEEWFPPVPSRDAIPAANSISVGDLRRLHWISDRHPYLMLVPLNPFEGSFFERLKLMTRRNIPVGHSTRDGAFFLAPDLMVQMSALEKNMRAAVTAMNRITAMTSAQHDTDRASVEN